MNVCMVTSFFFLKYPIDMAMDIDTIFENGYRYE